jgi:ABC-2 type transport system ATP-binding protein
MIRTEGLTKQYSGRTVLDLPALEIGSGESFGLVGNNGAGKTTFFSLVLDLVEATSGRVYSNDADVKRSEHWKDYTGSFLDERFLIDFLTPEEYFDFVRKVAKVDASQYEEFLGQFKSFFNGEILGTGKYIRDLSKGNQKKIGLAAAFMANPEVVVLDEPFPHLDPSTVIRFKGILQDYRAARNVTLLVSSHDLNHVTEVCDRIAILEHGKIVQDLRTNETTLEVLKAYFAP